MKHFLPPLFLSMMTFSMQVYTQQLYERLPYDNIWMLGNDVSNIRIDYSASSPIVNLANTPIDFDNTNASICRADGSLLMYSNGFRVLNGGHQYLENGFRINEQYDYPEDWLQTGNRLFQGMLILPQATDTNIYHLFYTEPVYFFNEDGQLAVSANNIYYAEANFLENQQGVIIDKDFLIVSDTLDFGKITACRHGNGRDWWVFAVNLDANQYHRILVTDQGVEDYGITSDGSAMRPTLGQIHFTPDGKRLVNAGLAEISEHDITAYDFDRCTGELTNANTTTFISDSITITGGMAISENSRFVYTTEQYHVYQYDLNAADVWSSRTLIEIWDGYYNGDNPGFFWANFGRAQLARDGKIYVSTPGSGRQYHIIHNPNKRGAASNFEQRGLAFTRWNNRSIPNFPYYGLGPWDGSPCDTLNIDNPVPEARYEHTQDSSALQLEFFDASHYAYEWSWDFGDGSATATEQHPIHTYSEIGTYEVCLTVSNVTGIDTHCETIQIGPVGTQEIFAPGVAVKVWPNPVSKEPLYFQISGLDNKNTIYLYLRDSQGRLILKDTFPVTGGADQHQLNIDHLPPGLYFYELYGQRLLASGKVVIGR